MYGSDTWSEGDIGEGARALEHQEREESHDHVRRRADGYLRGWADIPLLLLIITKIQDLGDNFFSFSTFVQYF